MCKLFLKSSLALWVTISIFFSIHTQAEPLKIVTLEYPPYIFDNKGKVDGMATKVVQEVFRRLDQPIEIEILPWARSIHYLRAGRADAIYTIFKTQERMQFADYSEQILFQQSIALFTTKDRSISFDGNIEGLADYSFCVVIGVSYGEIFDKAVKSGKLDKIFETRSANQCLQLLLRGRVDIWVNNYFGALAIANSESQLSKLKTIAPSIQSTASYIAFSKLNDHQDMRDKFDQALTTMKQDGTYKKIIEAFVGPQENMMVP
ncbi:substrate-binding periplasmic protein [Vibrio marisflavi]|uniref:Amino-acid-binding protein YxeM n=1 Tax=Vibrio marisflavi CECT 7928 TaxID=634439 RepID=A0ABN8E0A9_9VIBR|nr:transporter substrate-binding domain-containing protein [Vibrio marisflavi]CAH0537683.1 putative amino-acid-binding protein YxeM [Vibrio marisflavi CECT 7928]